MPVRRANLASVRAGKAVNAACGSAFFRAPQGRIADRGHDAQQFRASGLNLVIAAIVYWNSTYIVDAIAHLQDRGQPVPQALLPHPPPLAWEHIGFSGDFLWDQAAATAGRRRQLNFRRPRAVA